MSYYKFFNMNRDPFPMLGVSSFIDDVGNRRRISRAIINEAERGVPIILVVAPPGMGKSVLAEHVYHEISRDPEVRVGIVRSFPKTQDGYGEMLRSVDRALFRKKARPVDILNAVESDQRFVVIIDEAHELDEGAVKALHDILQHGGGRLSFVLLGHEALKSTLSESLLSRTGDEFLIPPLNEKETFHYLNALCAGAGFKGVLFDEQVSALICKRAQGVPRKINELAAKTLIHAKTQDRPMPQTGDIPEVSVSDRVIESHRVMEKKVGAGDASGQQGYSKVVIALVGLGALLASFLTVVLTGYNGG